MAEILVRFYREKVIYLPGWKLTFNVHCMSILLSLDLLEKFREKEGNFRPLKLILKVF